MDDMITVVPCGPEQKFKVFNGSFWALKWLFLSLPVKTQGSVSVKKLQVGGVDWTCVKEVLGCTINTEYGTVALPNRKLQ